MSIDVSESLGWFPCKDSDSDKWHMMNHRLRTRTTAYSNTREGIVDLMKHVFESWHFWAHSMAEYVNDVESLNASDIESLNNFPLDHEENLDDEAFNKLIQIFNGFWIKMQVPPPTPPTSLIAAVQTLRRAYPNVYADFEQTKDQLTIVPEPRPPFVAEVKIQKPRTAQMGRVRRELERVTKQNNGGTIFLQSEDATVLLKLLKKDKKRKAKKAKADKNRGKAKAALPESAHE